MGKRLQNSFLLRRLNIKLNISKRNFRVVGGCCRCCSCKHNYKLSNVSLTCHPEMLLPVIIRKPSIGNTLRCTAEFWLFRIWTNSQYWEQESNSHPFSCASAHPPTINSLKAILIKYIALLSWPWKINKQCRKEAFV